MNPSLGWGHLPEGWWSWDGTTGLWVVMNSLWNGSKSGWGDWVLAEETVAMVGAQLGQVGLDSVLKGEKLHLQPTLSSWDPHCQFCPLHNTPPPGLAERA